MNEKPPDKRVRRTRQALGEALIALALEGNYDKITIQDITARAGVGYRTFFRHYADKDALLADVLRSTVVELRRLMGNPVAARRADEPYLQFLTPENGRVLFTHIQDKSDLYRVLLDSGPVVLDPVVAYARQEAAAALPLAQPGGLPADLLASYLVTTTIDLVRWWLDNDMPYPPQEMGRYLARLTTLPQETGGAA